MVDLARRQPGTVLASVLGFHLVVWTLLPVLISSNLQLDLVEDLALGKEWQLGYWKHPPLPWWVADLSIAITGQIDAVYVLGPLAVVVCFYAVWLLAREIVGELKALIAVARARRHPLLQFLGVKFAHDQMQLPFWAFTGLFFYRALVRGRITGLAARRRYSWPVRSGRSTRPSRSPRRSGCSCCSIRSRAAPGARRAPRSWPPPSRS